MPKDLHQAFTAIEKNIKMKHTVYLNENYQYTVCFQQKHCTTIQLPVSFPSSGK